MACDSTLIDELLGKPVTTFEQLRVGRNSRVFRAVCADGTKYAVKEYEPSGTWDRLDTEYRALELMHQKDISTVPHAILRNDQHRVGIYSFIDGTPLPQRVGMQDMHQAVAYISALARIRPEECTWRKIAAEGCRPFSLVLDDTTKRAFAIYTAERVTPLHKKAARFAEKNILEALALLPLRNNLLAETAIPQETVILSPSDFGFHNAIRQADNSVVFLDFEYFGWDDPAKTVADFLLHPAMHLTESQKLYFVRELHHALPCPDTLSQRLSTAFVLYGLKWCTILLNEFLPNGLARRRFAGDHRPEEEILQEQYEKMKKMFRYIEKTYTRFPYGF